MTGMLFWLGILAEYFFYGIWITAAQPHQCGHFIDTIPSAGFYIGSDCRIIVCRLSGRKLTGYLGLCLYATKRPLRFYAKVRIIK